MLGRAALLFVLAAAALVAADRLYLKDGTYQLTNQYEVKTDRVRYYSTERSEWEEIPLELVDLERTKAEFSERKAQVEADSKAEAEERAAERAAAKQIAALPTQPGAYYIRGDQIDPIKQAESKIVNNKRRSILKALSPIPVIMGKATVELDGERAAFSITDPKPEFYLRATDYEEFEIVKLMPGKNTRIVERLTIAKFQDMREVSEEVQKIGNFKKQEADLLFRIWPQNPLEPGEYALLQYTPGKLNAQIWDFSVGKK
ncbi:MAG: hypothetical protein EXQ47_01645 [Bryobacterales bacterium]|nr:hypothetical protein [Bryobacterales bacterium]